MYWKPREEGDFDNLALEYLEEFVEKYENYMGYPSDENMDEWKSINMYLHLMGYQVWALPNEEEGKEGHMVFNLYQGERKVGEWKD